MSCWGASHQDVCYERTRKHACASHGVLCRCSCVCMCVCPVCGCVAYSVLHWELGVNQLTLFTHYLLTMMPMEGWVKSTTVSVSVKSNAIEVAGDSTLLLWCHPSACKLRHSDSTGNGVITLITLFSLNVVCDPRRAPAPPAPEEDNSGHLG